MSKRNSWSPTLSCPLAVVLATVMVILMSASAALAGPGGIIKAAAGTTLGRIVMCIVAVLLLPFIVYFYIRRRMQVRRTVEDLGRLSAAYPQYRWLDTKDRIIETFNFVWSAWRQEKMDLASQFTTPWYWQNQQLQLDEWRDRGLENVCHVVKINSIEPLLVQHSGADGEGSRLVVSISARVVDYLRDRKTGKIEKGDDKEGDLEAIWTFVWKSGGWLLNLVEADAEEWNYLAMRNEIPATLPQPVGASAPSR